MRLRAAHRLFLSYLLLISLVVLALSLGADSLLRRHLLLVAERNLERDLRLSAALYRSLPDLSPDSAADHVAALSGNRVTVIGPDGRVIGESTQDGPGLREMESHRHRPEVVAALRSGFGTAMRQSETMGTEQLYMAQSTPGGGVVRVSVPLAEVDAAIDRVQRGVLGVGAVALGLAGLFSLAFSIAVTRPLRRVRAAATAMAAGNLSIRLREEGKDELGELARGLDTLAAELQRRLAQLEGERAEMQALIDSMSEGVLAISADGSLRRANPAAKRMFVLHEPVSGLAPEAVSRRPEFLRLVRRAVSGRAVSTTELVHNQRALLATAHPLPDGGAVLVFLDLSELRRLEEVRRDFVANASHELKTPLTAIRGYSETLLDPELSPELTRRFAEVVHANAERLQRIVDDLLDLTRIESGGWTVEPRVVTLRDLAEEAWSALGDAARDARLRFGIDLEPGAERVLADPAAVQQILVNLFSNACRHTPDGGSVELHAALRPDAGGDMVELQVRDSGTGIPAIHLPRIFERFYRVDPARSRSEGGTGLGLAIVKHLVEAHGGSVRAESELGQGTTIVLTLPAATAD